MSPETCTAGAGVFTARSLTLDPATAAARIASEIKDAVARRLRRRGVVVGLSGGVDSSVVAALAVRALGAARVVGLLMPERESSPDSVRLGRLVADTLGIPVHLEDITATLTAAGCYEKRDAAIRSVVPEYGDGWRCKIVPPEVIDRSVYAVYSVVVQTPDGEERRVRLPADAALGIVAATNFKQRVRKMMEYYYADRLKFAVAGTPNVLEYDQGFFVKNGDGAADLKPIAHLYKSQVYQLASFLNVPAEIRQRPPTTDTYPMDQSQDEFYFGLPLERADLCLYARNHDVDPEDAAPVVGLTAEQVRRAYRMIDSRREAARYLHEPPVLVAP